MTREELASVKTAAQTSRARRRPLKSPLKRVEATAEKGARAKNNYNNSVVLGCLGSDHFPFQKECVCVLVIVCVRVCVCVCAFVL